MRAWMSNYIKLFHMYAITNPLHNPDAGFANIYLKAKEEVIKNQHIKAYPVDA